MKTTTQIVGKLAAGIALALGLSLTTQVQAALTPEQRAAMRALAEESTRQLEEATSNMVAQSEARLAEWRKTHPEPTAAQLEAQAQAAIAQLESNRLAVLPYLHKTKTMPDGTP